MENTNQIGLDKEQAKYIADRLNHLLANYSVLYINTRGMHWNIRGANFFELHRQFEKLYKRQEKRIDEIAERILSLGHTPKHAFSDYLNVSVIKEVQNISQPEEAVNELLNALKIIILQQKEVQITAEKANDLGTSDIMTEYIRDQEKTVWMLTAFLQETVWA